MGGFSELHIVILTTSTLNQDLSDYVGPDVELVVSPVNNAVAPATQLTSLQLIPTPNALTSSGDSGGHIQRVISRIFFVSGPILISWRFRYLPHGTIYMMVISGTGGGALALFFASHESNFKVPSDCYTMASHRVLRLAAERFPHVRKCPWCNETP
jgi:hypothetical protein